jgi:hypothetical protein
MSANSLHPSFGEAFRFWLKPGFTGFCGPAEQIAIMHRELVEKLQGIDERRFLRALNELFGVIVAIIALLRMIREMERNDGIRRGRVARITPASFFDEVVAWLPVRGRFLQLA